MGTPPPDFRVDDDVIGALLTSQVPHLAGEALGERFEGWDNVTVRLGEFHAVRLPRLRAAVPLLEVEQRWLPTIAARLPVAVPVPVFQGSPSDAFQAPWSIVPWIEGDDAGEAALSQQGLADLGAALAALHVQAPSDAPVCEWRAGPLSERKAEFAVRLDQLGARVDAAAALTKFDTAVRSDAPGTSWIHADIHARNMVVRGGRLAGIIDWGEVSRGSRLIDLAQVWVWVGAEAFAGVMSAYGVPLAAADHGVFQGHAMDAATRLALSPDPAHHVPAWRALAELGLARGT